MILLLRCRSKQVNIQLFYFAIILLLTACQTSAIFTPPNQPADAAVSGSSSTRHPTIVDFWEGTAHFTIDIVDTGLPMGESDTLSLSHLPEQLDGANRTVGETLRSYVHASQQSAAVYDSCGDAVAFPGCTVIYQSSDGGDSFSIMADSQQSPTCLLSCATCPCVSERDHIDQQQYPRVVTNGKSWWMVYEYRANVMLRRSVDGLKWSAPEMIPMTGIWQDWFTSCQPEERIGPHPFAPATYNCLVGGPPGLFLDDETLYIFVGLGQNPGSMGCYRGDAYANSALFRKCSHNPLFRGVESYGPLDENGAETNSYFDFRTISSAELLKVGKRYYMFYEGVRGPKAGDGGDTQFGLGLARSLTDQIDGPWERFGGNPLLIDQPGNVGVGHADVVRMAGQIWLYTSVDGVVRSRLKLEWK